MSYCLGSQCGAHQDPLPVNKGSRLGLWIDLEAAWARTAGNEPSVSCKLESACLGGTRRDFVMGCLLAAADLSGCSVDG